LAQHEAEKKVQEIDEALASKMSPEEEEAVQTELAELEREAMVRSYSMNRRSAELLDSQPAIPSLPESERVSLPSAPVEEPTVAEEAPTEGMVLLQWYYLLLTRFFSRATRSSQGGTNGSCGLSHLGARVRNNFG